MTGKEVIFISAILLLFLSFLNFVSAQEVPVCFGAELRDDRPCETYGDECSDEGQSAMDGPGSGYYYNSTSDEFTQCYDYADRCGDSGRCDGCPSSEQDLNKIIEKLEFVYDEEYVEQTKKERLFDPNSRSAPTPFDKMKVKIKVPKVYESCLGNLKGVLSKGGVEVYSGAFSLSPLKSSDSRYVYYELIVDANPMTKKAWTEDAETLKKLIASKNVEIIVKKQDSANEDQNNYITKREVGACLRLWGPDGTVQYQYEDVEGGGKIKNSDERANFKFVTVLWDTDKDISDLLDYAWRGKIAFDSIDPFRSYKERFAYELDLEKTNTEAKKKFSLEDAEFLSKISSCEGATTYYVFTDTDKKEGAYAVTGNKIFAVFSSFISKSNLGKVIIHETGHAFCGLVEEYTLDVNSQLAILITRNEGIAKINIGQCAETYPLYFLPYGKTYSGCYTDKYIRSSNKYYGKSWRFF